MEKQLFEQIQEYVYKNYSTHKDKPLIIVEHDNHYAVKLNKDSYPLVLSKSILDK